MTACFSIQTPASRFDNGAGGEAHHPGNLWADAMLR